MSTYHETDKNLLKASISGAVEMLSKLEAIQHDLSIAADFCAEALRSGGTVFYCGNGGSAAESQHLATEFVVRLSSARNRKALPAIALTTDTSLLTACANDFGFDRVFARQVEAHLRKGDVLILLSTSGKSPNLIEAAKAARAQSGRTIGFLGADKTPLDSLLDCAIHVPSHSSQHVQEAHLQLGHLMVEMVENRLLTSN